jgi:hypothetical protein
MRDTKDCYAWDNGIPRPETIQKVIYSPLQPTYYYYCLTSLYY